MVTITRETLNLRGDGVGRDADAAVNITSPVRWTVTPDPKPRIYHVAVSSDGPPYTVYCVELPGAVSEGGTLGDALTQIREAIDALIEDYREDGDPLPWTYRDVEDGYRVVDAISVDG